MTIFAMNNSHPLFNLNFIRTFSLVSFWGLSSLLGNSPAQAFTVTFSNPDFETGLTGWNTSGDVTVQQGFQTINPPNGSNHALITNSCPGTVFPTGECNDTQIPTNFRQDDPTADDTRTFNFSGSDQTSATDLQTFLGLNSTALAIPRAGGLLTGSRVPSEGSAITQTITVSDPFELIFDYNFLTNDGTHELLGNQDYSFVTLYDQSSSPASRTVDVLDDSSGVITTPILSTQTDFEKVGGYANYSSGVLQAGTYTIGLGVVDVDGTGISSGLLVDNFEVQEVPFDFSAVPGLGLVIGFFGWKRLRRQLQLNKQKRSSLKS